MRQFIKKIAMYLLQLLGVGAANADYGNRNAGIGSKTSLGRRKGEREGGGGVDHD